MIYLAAIASFTLGLSFKAIYRAVNGLLNRIPTKEHHYKADVFDYYGGYIDVTRCQSCGDTASRRDQHPANPCNNCGGDIIEAGAAKWGVKDGYKQWIFSNSNR